MLQSANIEGDVVVDAMIDSLGRLDRRGSRVVGSVHELFTMSVWNGLSRAAFTPGQRGGVASSGLWRDTIEFRLQDDTIPCEPPRDHHRRICAAPQPVRRISLPLTAEANAPSSPTTPLRIERQEWHDSLLAGHSRWLRSAPPAYRVEIVAGCWCSSLRGPERVVVDVRNGRIIRERRSAPPRDSSSARMQFWHTWTIDSLFAASHRVLADDGRRINQLELDPRYGFPRRLDTEVSGTDDSWSRIEVRSFVPLRRAGSNDRR
jgi:hypothetical protein